jgi:hypothetical protein
MVVIFNTAYAYWILSITTRLKNMQFSFKELLIETRIHNRVAREG